MILFDAQRWQDYTDSGNPVYPYEWTLYYLDGPPIHRLKNGVSRGAFNAPTRGIRSLRVTGPPGTIHVHPLTPNPDRIDVRASVVRPAHRFSEIGAITAWHFGFVHGNQYRGVQFNALHQMRTIEGSWPFKEETHEPLATKNTPLPAGPDEHR